MKKFWIPTFILLASSLVLFYQNCSGVRLQERNSASQIIVEPEPEPGKPPCTEDCGPTTTTLPSPPPHPYRFISPAAGTTLQAGQPYTLTWVPRDADFSTHFPTCTTTQVRFLQETFYNGDTGTSDNPQQAVVSDRTPTGSYIATYVCIATTGEIILDQRTFEIVNPDLAAGQFNIIEQPFSQVFRREFGHFGGNGFGTRLDWYFDLNDPRIMGYPMTTRFLANTTTIDLVALRFVAHAADTPDRVNYGAFNQNLDSGQIAMFFSKQPGDLTWSANRTGCSIYGINLGWRITAAPGPATGHCVLTPGETYYLNVSTVDLNLARQGALVSLCNNTEIQPRPDAFTCRWWGAMSFLN